MKFNEIALTTLIGDRPRIEYGPPKPNDDGNWLTSGKLIVEFVQGPFVPVTGKSFEDNTGLAIAVPFEDAKNEQDALLQAAEHLKPCKAILGRLWRRADRERPHGIRLQAAWRRAWE
jgi:hypothetical protein